MPRGPLPNPDAARRNAPTIPTTSLSASGRSGPAPALPFGYDLGEHGSAWWAWAWALPQALAWSTGDLYVVARRASLEDDLAALGKVESLDALDLLEGLPTDAKRLVDRLAGLAGSKAKVSAEMTQLDDRLGLNLKAMAALRLKIIDDGTQPASGSAKKKPAAPGRRSSALKVLNGGAAS